MRSVDNIKRISGLLWFRASWTQKSWAWIINGMNQATKKHIYGIMRDALLLKFLDNFVLSGRIKCIFRIHCHLNKSLLAFFTVSTIYVRLAVQSIISGHFMNIQLFVKTFKISISNFSCKVIIFIIFSIKIHWFGTLIVRGPNTFLFQCFPKYGNIEQKSYLGNNLNHH